MSCQTNVSHINWNIRADLSIEDDLIVIGHWLVIPHSIRRKVLQQLHESHQRRVQTKQRAQLAVYWPNITNDFDNIVLSCKTCQGKGTHHSQTLTRKTIPRNCNRLLHLCIIVDCFSNWPEIVPMQQKTTTPRLTAALRSHFCHTGVPNKIWSDQGPQFSSKLFQDFAKQWGFKHTTSSPTYPQSKGKAEATAKSMKKLIQPAWTGQSINEDKLTQALLQYRNTPARRDGLPPAQKLFGHEIQDPLPAHRRAFAEQWQHQDTEADQQKAKPDEEVEQSCNQHAKPLSDLNVGNRVAVQNQDTIHWDIYSTITDIGPHCHYFIKTQWLGIGEESPLSTQVCTIVSANSSAPMDHHQGEDHLEHHPPSPSHRSPRRSSRTHRKTNLLIETFCLQNGDSQRGRDVRKWTDV